jgi:hypothetical protein
MRPGNYWSYLLICALALIVAHAKALPIGQQVAGVFQQVIDGLKMSPGSGAVETPGSGGSYDIPAR